MRTTWIVTGALVVVSGLFACSGESGGGGGGAEKSSAPVGKQQPTPQPSATTDPNQPASSTDCVAKGAKGNALGVGTYCTKGAECAEGLFCTAEFGAPAGADFCTKPCAADSDCGDGAVCYSDPRGRGCVPKACAGK